MPEVSFYAEPNFFSWNYKVTMKMRFNSMRYSNLTRTWSQKQVALDIEASLSIKNTSIELINVLNWREVIFSVSASYVEQQ